MAKLDTIVHELYHIAPDWSGIRGLDGATGDRPGRAHSPAFYRQVAAMVEQYLATGPPPELMDFLRHGARELVRRYGEVAATTFDSFPSFPQPYLVPLAQQPLPVEDGPGVADRAPHRRAPAAGVTASGTSRRGASCRGRFSGAR